MNLPAALSIASAALGLSAALLCALISRTVRGTEMRWFSVMAAAGGVFAAANALSCFALGLPEMMALAQITVLAAGLHTISWIPYTAATRGGSLNRVEQLVVAVGLVSLLAPFFPRLLFVQQLNQHSVPWLGVTYTLPITTPLANAMLVFYCGVLIIPLVSFSRRFANREKGSGSHVAALALLITTGVSDTITTTLHAPMPFVLDFGFFGIVALIGGGLAHRFVETSRSLEDLSARLESTVARRTRELSIAAQALQRAEKLAAIGQLAAGVAHEVNNPAAVVRSNLDYLRTELLTWKQLPADTEECLAESLSSIDRIARIVQQLLDAGRVAARPQGAAQPLAVLDAAAAAVQNARVTVPAGVQLVVEVDPAHHVLGNQPLLEQVLLNLVLNATQAITHVRQEGRVVVRSERVSGQVHVLVTDDGPGIAPEVRPRLFEPFVTTEALGRGTGLGLAVSMGLMQAQGGELTLRSSDASGTTFVVALPLTGAPTLKAAAEAPRERASLRLLLVDDEPLVLTALHRQLNPYFLAVETAPTVALAVARLKQRAHRVDVVICDLMMPDGGGERLLRELATLEPPFQGHTLFMTGGASTALSQRFAAEHAGQVLQKPISLDLLLEHLRSLR